MKLHLDGLHRATPFIYRLYSHPGRGRQASKQAIFIPTHDTITSPELAKLFLLHVFSKHGVPAHVTSDRGTEFVSHFFQSLGKALDMRLHFTSGYHPEGDGQTERSNQTLEQYLRIYCNYQQDNWADLLPLAEFIERWWSAQGRSSPEGREKEL